VSPDCDYQDLDEAARDAIVEGYRQTYGFSQSAELDSSKIFQHWALEVALTKELLASKEDERHTVAEKAYTELYEQLRWHDDHPRLQSDAQSFTSWEVTVGDAPLDIYEIGSGRGELLQALAAAGHRCKGTEITSERGERYDSESQIRWGTTDGVHLDRFEPPASYDVLLSNQVLEHLHPDDLDEHFRSAKALLRPGGTYVLSTPNRLTGPHDVSDIFGCLNPRGMHLKEYSWTELSRAMRDAGFVRVGAATTARLHPLLSRLGMNRPWARGTLGASYLFAMKRLEAILSRIRDRRTQRHVSYWLRRRRIFADNIFLVGHVPASDVA
jgi:2-polyprenyl-3-methyl-5-hydroxy-6-metoxy-1,4-benzoquinol methylase